MAYNKIGIRMALGAGDTDVFRMVLRMGLRLIGIGVAAGLLHSFAVRRVIASQLWGVSPYDPMTMGGVVGVVGMVGLAACYFPARRATRGPAHRAAVWVGKPTPRRISWKRGRQLYPVLYLLHRQSGSLFWRTPLDFRGACQRDSR
jgi:hypothetical protein